MQARIGILQRILYRRGRRELNLVDCVRIPEDPASSRDGQRRSEPEGPVEVSIIFPCLNEADSVASCIQKAAQAVRQEGLSAEIIVADNGSSDGSEAIAVAAGAKVVRIPKRGYGSAVLGGIAAARGRYVIMADADDTYDVGDLGRFVSKLAEGNDLVIGNRFLGGIERGAMPWLHRYVGTPILTRIGKVLFHCPVGDINCGIRGLSKSEIKRLDLRATGMEFASEMVVKATLHKLRIAEIPTRIHPAAQTRSPHLKTWRDGWRHLRFLLLYSPSWLFLYPGFVLMAAGLGIGLWLLPAPRRLGSVTLDAQTLLFAAMSLVVGFQSVIFAIFTKVFATREGLLPAAPRFDRILKHVTLEVGAIIGILLLVAGAIGSGYAFWRWSLNSFGALDAPRSLRVVIPSLTSLVLGSQVLLSSFFLSLLGLQRR